MAKTSREFAVRSLSAAALASVAIALAWWDGIYLTAGVAIVAAISILELRSMSIAAGWGFALLPALFLAGFFVVRPQLTDAHRLTADVTATLVIALTLSIRFVVRPRRKRAIAWFAGVVGAFYIGGLGSVFVALRGFSEGFIWVLLAFVAIWAYDTGAYLGGRFFGKHFFAPRISPKKTWEGVAAGAGAVLICVVIFEIVLPIEAWHIPILSVLLAVAAQAGDLLESALKRVAGVKNSGSLIPGHGGILDRIDSLLLAGPVVYVYASFITDSGPFA
ncbi:MAG: phosphatidate cytidylyltransferase [Gammaproteobacteria bacterium]|nr:phosphatidate cytidylyltransferase [Gammaproteobacteria bacterium]